MRTSGNNTSPKQLTDLLKKGEGQTLEFKRSTIAEAAEKTGTSHGTRTDLVADPVSDPAYRLLALLQKGELSSSQLREAYGMRDQE